MRTVRIIGGGLAGCEAAWQLASRGCNVILYEMRPGVQTPVHHTGDLAELVCSNSLKSDTLPSAQALLKQELRILGSMLLGIAEQARVPAGKALAVDRDEFARRVTSAISAHRLIEIRHEEVTDIERMPRPCIIASGPMTSADLTMSMRTFLGMEHLYFFDAISPIIDAETIDFSELFRGDRYGDSEGDYWNIPLSETAYKSFVSALREADPIPERPWEKMAYFESCLPIEEIARRGDRSLAFGPFRPVGLYDRDGVRPYAVIQLRLEDTAASSYNLVGCQTRLPISDQKRIFRSLPGLKNAAFLRYGQLHRNTYVEAPRLLESDLSVRIDSGIRIAGQLCGTEGYMESIGTGLLAGLFFWMEEYGTTIPALPEESMLGALCSYVSATESKPFQPMNANFGLLPEAPKGLRGKARRRAWHAENSRTKLLEWVQKQVYRRPVTALTDRGDGNG